MTDQFTVEDFQDLAEANKRTQELKKFVIERGEIFYRLNGKPLNLRYDDGFQVQVNDRDLFAIDRPDIIFTQEDTRGGHKVATHKVPRDFVFAVKKTEKELKWEQYLALKAELEPGQVAPAPRKKFVGIVRDQADVTGCYWECYGVYCDKDTAAGDRFCTKHKDQKCRMCGEPADHGCPAELQFVCGEPLCRNHQIGRH